LYETVIQATDGYSVDIKGETT